MKLIANTFNDAKADVSEVGQFYADRINGTVDVEFGSKTITAWAIKSEYGIAALGFVGRYRTSRKPWRASVSVEKTGERTRIYFGRDDRVSSFSKNSINFEPKTFFAA